MRFSPRFFSLLLLFAFLLVVAGPAGAQNSRGDLSIVTPNTDPKEGELISFAVRGESVEGEVEWDFGDGTTDRAEASTSHRFVDDGTYTVKATARTSAGAVLRGQREISIRNARPTIRVIDGDLTSAERTVRLEAVVVDPGANDDLAYTWDFGDGTTKEGGKVVSHTYETSGTYVLRLTVSDGDGGTAERAERIGAGIHFTGTVGGVEVMGEATARLLYDGNQCSGTIILNDEDYGKIWVRVNRRPNIAAPGTYQTEDDHLIVGFVPNAPTPSTAGRFTYHSEKVACSQPETIICPPHEIAPGWLRVKRARPEMATAKGEKVVGVIPGWFKMDDYEDFEPSHLEGRLAAPVRMWTVTDPGIQTGPNMSRDEYGPTQSMMVEAQFAFPAGFIHPGCILPQSKDGLDVVRWGRLGSPEPAGETGSVDPEETAPSSLPAPALLARGPAPHGPGVAAYPPHPASDMPLLFPGVPLDDEVDYVHDGDKNVDYRRAKIVVTFNKNIDAASVTAESVQIETMLKNGTRATTPYTSRVDGREVILTPSRPLRPGTRYRVTAREGAGGVTGVDGETLDAPEAMFFETVVKVDEVKVHTYQSSRDAAIVFDKPIATRVYVDWTNDDAIHKDWQVTSFPASVSVYVENSDDLLYSTEPRVELKRLDLWSDLAKMQMKHTVNFFSPDARLSRPSAAFLRARVRPIRELSGGATAEHQLHEEHTAEGTVALNYVQSELSPLHLVGLYMTNEDWSSPAWTQRIGSTKTNPKSPGLTDLLKASHHASLEFLPFSKVKTYGPFEVPVGRQDSLIQSKYDDGSPHYYVKVAHTLKGQTFYNEVDVSSYLQWKAHEFIMTEANDVNDPFLETNTTVYTVVFPDSWNTSKSVGGWTIRKGMEIKAVRPGQTLGQKSAAGNYPVDVWPEEASQRRLTLYPVDRVHLPLLSLYVVHEVGHALNLDFRSVTSTEDPDHTCKKETQIPSPNVSSPKPDQTVDHVSGEFAASKVCPNRLKEIPIEGLRQDSHSWTTGVNKSDEEGDGHLAGGRAEPVALMNPYGLGIEHQFTTNEAYLQLINYLDATSAGLLPRTPFQDALPMQAPQTQWGEVSSGPSADSPAPPAPPPPALSPPNEGTLLIRGALTADEVLLFGSVQTYPRPVTAPAPDSGPYTARMLDAQGTVSSTVDFQPQGYSGVTHGGEGDEALRPFSLAVPGEDVAAVEIVRGEDLLFSRERSTHAPKVSFSGSEPLRVSDRTEVRWTGEDADGDTLTYTLSYNRGVGPWVPLAIDQTAPSFTLDGRTLKPGPRPRLRLTASDGFDAARAWVDVEIAEPLTAIDLMPAPGDTSADRSGAIVASFSTELDPATINHERFTLTRGETSVPANVQYNEHTNGIVLMPLTALHPDRAYTVRLAPGVASRYGQTLDDAISWTFRTDSLPDTVDASLPDLPLRATTSEEDVARAKGDEPKTEAEQGLEKAKEGLRNFFDEIRKAAEEENDDGSQR